MSMDLSDYIRPSKFSERSGFSSFKKKEGETTKEAWLRSNGIHYVCRVCDAVFLGQDSAVDCLLRWHTPCKFIGGTLRICPCGEVFNISNPDQMAAMKSHLETCEQLQHHLKSQILLRTIDQWANSEGAP